MRGVSGRRFARSYVEVLKKKFIILLQKRYKVIRRHLV